MAEERNLVPAGAPAAEDADIDPTKQELQRRMEEAREQISQTVTEIKETVVNQYQQVKTSINDSLDWREQYRRHAVPFTVGAFGAGLLIGRAVGGSFGGGEVDDDLDADHDAAFDRIESGFDKIKKGRASKKPYAASPILGAATAFGSSDIGRAASSEKGAAGAASARSRPTSAASSFDDDSDTRSSAGGVYRPAEQPSGESSSASGGVSTGFGSFGSSSGESGSRQADAADETPSGPSLMERFKETKAYDRLQEELTTIGERVVDELSRTAQTVILPALLGKLKDFVGIDLGTQHKVAQRTRVETESAEAQQRAAAATEGKPSGGGSQGAGGSANFATSGGA